MKITIVAAGKIKEKYLTAGINEFLKRLGTFANVKIVEINEEKMKDNPSEAEKQQVLAAEGQRLLHPYDSRKYGGGGFSDGRHGGAVGGNGELSDARI